MSEHPQPSLENSNGTPGESSETSLAATDRRGFFTRLLAGAVGLVAGLIPFVTGVVFFFDPLLRKRTSVGESEGGEKEDGFINLGVSAEALPADGTPQMFKVHDDVVDAWNKFLNVEIGSVWLRRDPDGTLKDVTAFSSICPHLGCTVDFRSAAQDFYCPCHRSAFSLTGERQNDIPPRGMDKLDVKVKDDHSIWVKYVEYRSGEKERIPVA